MKSVKDPGDGDGDGDAAESMRNDFKCLANSLAFSKLTACPAFLMITN
jgi:hypothetical protein